MSSSAKRQDSHGLRRADQELTLDYEDAFTELIILEQKTWINDETMKRYVTVNSQNIGMVDAVLNL
jgi:hypothetical protein